MIQEAHVFQHKYSGVQIFVYHVTDEIQAKQKFAGIVNDSDDWIYLGKKSVINSQLQYVIQIKVLYLFMFN